MAEFVISQFGITVPATATTLFSTGARQAKIENIAVHNTTAGSLTFTLRVGGVPIWVQAVAAGATQVFSTPLWLPQNTVVTGFGSAAGLRAHISAIYVPKLSGQEMPA